MNFFENLVSDSNHQVKTIHIYGSAPTVKNSISIKEKCVKIAVGDMPWRAPEFGPYDYWLTANSYFPLPWRRKDLRILKKFTGITFINSTCVDRVTDKNQLSKVLQKLRLIQESNNKIIFYDQMHFSNKLCNPSNPRPCCIFYKYFNLDSTIQETFSRKFNVELPYTLGHQTLSAIAFAIMLNAKTIYISGVELPKIYKDYKWYRNWKLPSNNLKLRFIIATQQYLPLYNLKSTDFSGLARQELLDGYSNLGKIAQKMEIKIYTTSMNSPLNNLPGYSYKSII